MPSIYLCKQPERRREAGFTAIEAMVVCAIVAILAAIAMPSFRDVVDRYRVRQVAEDLTAVLYQARSEAIKRGGRVSIRKAAPSDCSTDSAGDWSCGWIVFADTDNDGVLDVGEEELQGSPAPQNVNVKLVLGSGQAFMKVDAWGQFSGMGAFRIELTPKDNNNADLSMALCMSSGGRLKTRSGSTLCG